jgi:hypothetical protein
LLLLRSPVARAEQPRDWVLSATTLGTRISFDYFGTGAQATLEHRGEIYGSANSYSLSVTPLVSYPGGQIQGTAALRILFIELSASVGYRSLWRNLSFQPGDNGEYCKACDRPARRSRDPLFGSGPDSDHYPMFEGTVALYGPLNDWVFFLSYFSLHYEDSRARSYDQFLTDIHDGGLMLISETTLFFKHRTWGGIGPYVQILSLPRAGQHEVEVAWGLNAVTRLGLIKSNDALLFTLLLRPTDKYYGQHSYYMPVRTLLVYRMAFEL